MAAHKYTSKENVKQNIIPEANLDDDDTSARIEALIDAASAFADKYCDRPDAYFMPNTTAADRRYRGEGKNYLRVGRYHGNLTFTSPVVSPTSYYFDSKGWPRWNDQPLQNDSDYFPNDEPFFGSGFLYVVNAKWGFEATPPDIATAVEIIVGKMWDIGKGVMGEISPSGFVIDRAIPPTAAILLDKWKRREFELN